MDIFQTVKAVEEVVHSTDQPSIAGMFGLDWKLFLAQLVNFAIVLLILWKWVFKPVTRTLERRTRRIEESLKTADLVEAHKREFEQWKKGEITDARKQAGKIISQAKVGAEKVREEILAKARAEQKKFIETGRNSLKLEKEQLVRDAKEELAEVVAMAAGKILGEKIDSRKDEELIKKVISEIK